MTVIRADRALLPQGWAADVRLEIGADGRIASVAPGAGSAEGEALHVALLLPAPINAHSHAFQRAMAGLTEGRGPDADGQDSFWTWRQLMYRFLDQLTPEQVEAIAALVQMEMLEAGYAAVAEFHYLHHQPDGTPYDDIAEMSARIAAAAGQTGIGLTLLPVLYRWGGCDGRPLGSGQRRFGNGPDRFARIMERAAAALSGGPADWALGVAPHSLRAIDRETLSEVPAMTEGPIHMHIAEQVAEVEEVEAHFGARPVAWALENLPLSPRWNLVHCTQMTPAETDGLARSGATAILCPITESNLGDGIFDGVRFLAAGGHIAIGSDSNVRIGLTEELRTFEYSQRLRDHSRAALATDRQSTGRRLWEAVCDGGARAAGRASGALSPGSWADLIAVDIAHPDLAGLRGDAVLDALVFAAGDTPVSEVWSAGRHMVRAGRHIHRDAVLHRYARAVASLRA
ncbi:MAG: formimidoylglutamate deiminase [Pseudomonadota bacterium]